MTDKQLDDAIDRAVRDLVSGEPAGDLRQRVLADIAAAPRRSNAWRPLAYGTAALAVIVLIALNLVVRRPAVPETRVAGTPTPAPSVQTPVQPPSAAPLPAPQLAANAPRSESPVLPHRAAATPAVTAAATPPADRRVEAASISAGMALESESAVPERLAPVVPIGISTIGTARIEIAPIDIEPIDVAPLTPRR
jgi:hypothetical protein